MAEDVEAFGFDGLGGPAHFGGHVEAGIEEGLGVEMKDDIEEEGHGNEADENEGEDSEELAEKVVEAGDRFGEDGVEGAVFLVFGDDEGGGDDREDETEGNSDSFGVHCVMCARQGLIADMFPRKCTCVEGEICGLFRAHHD